MIRILLILLAVASLGAEEIRFKKRAIFCLGKAEFNLETEAGLRKLVDSSETNLAKRDARGLAMMRELAATWLGEKDELRKKEIHGQLLEIAHAVANNHRYPMPRYVDFVQAPFFLADALDNPIATKNIPSANDEPVASTFWNRPAKISEMNLAAGFGRTELPNYHDMVWNYSGPKKAGRNAGCELETAGRRIKVKFAELHSEPFTARIFHALGYNVMPTDYAPRLRVKYDRRFFTEFNSRPELRMRTGLLFIPVYSFNLQNVFDPFDFIETAVLKDGETVTAQDLRVTLMKKGNFDATVEGQIDYLVTKAANVQIEPRGWQSIGPWDFGQIGHEDLREVRAAGVIAAWLGWSDSRYENTRLRARRTSEGIELKHFLSDLGGGMGFCDGTFKRSSEKPQDFARAFTRSYKGRFEIVNYAPIQDTRAFERITMDDARWIAPFIASISEKQIKDALTAAGFSTEEVQIYAEKLENRREKFMDDLGFGIPALATTR